MSSQRRPGPITTKASLAKTRGYLLAPQPLPGVMGPGLRRDDTEYVAAVFAPRPDDTKMLLFCPTRQTAPRHPHKPLIPPMSAMVHGAGFPFFCLPLAHPRTGCDINIGTQ